MAATQTSTKQDAAVRETATRLRVGVGAFKRRTQETLAEGDLTVPQLTALSRLDRLRPSTTRRPGPAWARVAAPSLTGSPSYWPSRSAVRRSRPWTPPRG